MAATAVKSNLTTLVAIANKVTAWTGNRFLDKHYTMIESRLTRRFLQLKFSSIEEYYQYLQQNEDEEKEHLISLLTTHHTYFFRESAHFDFIKDTVLAELAQEIESRPDKTLRILSMACSKGHEVYSLATYLEYNLKKSYPKLDYRITATDVDIQSVNYAKNGVYPFEELKRVPMQYLEGYWIRGKGEISNFAKITKSIKDKCEFYDENLLDISQKTASKTFDVILCRNVFIYFDQAKIKDITLSLMKLMTPKGYLIVGISESLRGVIENLIPAGPSVYRNAKSTAKASVDKVVPINKKPIEIKPPVREQASLPNPIRVLCVDDSPTIHSVLSKLLSEKEGFKIVGKAMNGQEAVEFLKTNTVDVVTLDIHMPVMTGIEYLEKSFKKDHPAVVMMTSVTRENSDLAFKALTLGASDYVEKPTLLNMKEIAYELRTKIKSAITNRAQIAQHEFDKQFAKTLEVKMPSECLNIVVSSIGEREKVKDLIAKSYSLGIECAVVWCNARPSDSQIVESLFSNWGMDAKDGAQVKDNKIRYFLGLEYLNDLINENTKSKKKIVTSVTAGVCTLFVNENVNTAGKVILEETAGLDVSKIKRDWNVYPYTSMEYTIFEIFAK